MPGRSKAVTRSTERVAAAVDRAEDETGLQLCVYLGPAGQSDTRAHAVSLFAEAQPAVLILVALDERKVEIVTAPDVRERVPDADCDAAIEVMRPLLRKKRYDDALIAAVEHLARTAGPGTADPDAIELPDVIDDRDRKLP